MKSARPWTFHADSPAYFAAKLMEENTISTADYATSKLGNKALLSYENNNGFPTPDLEYFESVVVPSSTMPEWQAWDGTSSMSSSRAPFRQPRVHAAPLNWRTR